MNPRSRTKIWRALALGIVVGTAVGCATRSPAPPARLPNGLYAVMAESPAASAPPPAPPRGRMFFHDRRRADPTADAAPSYVTIDPADFVPLVLARPPESVPQPDGRIRLQVALSRDEVTPLARFTRRHVGGRAAIVLDGEVVTVHKVRSVIPDGHLQISRCTDKACRRIYVKLLEGSARVAGGEASGATLGGEGDARP